MAIGERYEMKKILGQGGNAKVYLVYDRDCGKNRAVKAVKKTGDGQAHHIVKTETELIRKLNYPYFPEIIEMLETADTDYIVMEYLEGESLGNRLRRMGPQSQKEVLRWGKDLSLMLDYLHHCSPPVIYRDMKPDNIMVQSGGNLRLIDFGAVLELGEENKAANLLLGTRGYAAPEQFDWKRQADPRTDIYGLGVTMYQLLTGKDPRMALDKGFSIRKCRRSFSRKLDKIIRTCTKENPSERYQSCKELWEELCNLNL